MSININKLGVRIDGWADLVEGAGEKAAEAQKALEQTIRDKQMPNVALNPTVVSAQAFGGRQRPYLYIEMPNGASMIIYIGAFGKDLYATWESYIRPVFNKQNIYILLGAAAAISFLGNINTNQFGGGGFNFFGWIFGTVSWAIGGAILMGGAGLVIRGNILAFFFKQLDAFDADDIGAMSLATHKSILHALDQVGISTQALRFKEQFRAGSRERLI